MFLTKITKYLFLLSVLISTHVLAASEPSHLPLLTSSKGAHPNVMLTLDNSGSMGWSVLDSYKINDADRASTNNKSFHEYTNWKCASGYSGPIQDRDGRNYCVATAATQICPSGYTGPKTDTDGSAYCEKLTTTYSCEIGWQGPKYNKHTGQQECSKKANWGTIKKPAIQLISVTKFNNAITLDGSTRYYGTPPYNSGIITATSTTISTSSSNSTSNTKWADGGGWYAMRSGEVNPLYYNPKITYKPPVDYNGITKPNPTLRYVVDAERSSLGANNGIESVSTNPSGRYPSLSTTSSLGSNDGFTYVNCKTYNASDNLGSNELSCTVGDRRPGNGNVTRITKSTTTVPLPAGHARTDCGSATATSCSATNEWINIYNWYSYYRTRAAATATSVGYALADPIYSGKMRVGFYNINKKSGNSGVDNDSVASNSQGTYSGSVRPFRLGDAGYSKNIFDWIESLPSKVGGGTPLHNAVNNVGDYYATKQPYYNDTINADTPSSPSLSCRRSYNILFSDGSWNGWKSSYQKTPFFNFTDASPTVYPSTSQKAVTNFQYSRVGDTDNKLAYIPYSDASGSGSSYSLAATTAQYYWGWDLQPNLINNINVRPGEPTNWQNMKTYTVGYGLDPVHITFEDIAKWQKFFLKAGYDPSQIPSWLNISSSDASDSGNSGPSTNKKIDDFIRAGYTGGGAGFSVFTAEDIRKVFSIILSDVVSASGNDAGVAVSGASNTTSTIEGAMKYTVDYRTIDNSGDVKAWVLDASGNNVENAERWSAAKVMGSPASKKLSTLSSTGPVTLGHNTTLNSLPLDIRSAINPNGTIAGDSSFIKYLRGDNAIANPLGEIYRQRTSPIGADVNSPPAYAGGRLDMGYSLSKSTVGGKASYADYTSDKGDIPGTLYVPSNDGQVHVINAANDSANPPEFIKSGGAVIEPGKELWSYLIKSSLGSLEDFAKSIYTFKYVLDGPVTEHDIYNPSTNAWRQIVYGSLGRGGKGGIYALNVPNNLVDKNRIPQASDYLWDITQPNMGYITNPVTTGYLANGSWGALVTSGHYAGTGSAGLYVLNANTGALIKYIPLPPSYQFGRGLGGITAIRNAQRVIIGAYAGDDNGNLWRFDLMGNQSATWKVLHNAPLFTAPNNQPIYAAPSWTVHPGDGTTCVLVPETGNCGTVVTIGTGTLLDNDDTLNVSNQAIYGIWDKTPINTPSLLDADYSPASITDLTQQTLNASAPSASSLEGDKTFFKSSKETVDWTTKRGWYINLSSIPNSAGERVIADPFNLGSSVFVSSVIIGNVVTTDESCIIQVSPPNVIYGLDAITGASKRSFDQNGDGRGDDFSIAYIPGGGYTRGNILTPIGDSLNGTENTTGLGLPNEGNAGLLTKIKCTGESGFNTGISGSMQVFDSCGAGWRRTWRQILNPPAL